MVIGFTQRRRNVSESDVDPGTDTFLLSISVAALRTSEIEHEIILRHQEQQSTAIVGTIFGGAVNSDAIFGSRINPGDPIQVFTILRPGQSALQPINAIVVQDFRVEDEECFTIRLYFSDFPGSREAVVTCNDDDGATDFFCEHTICIQDDDGTILNTSLI